MRQTRQIVKRHQEVASPGSAELLEAVRVAVMTAIGFCEEVRAG
jgi:hypothetical protein